MIGEIFRHKQHNWSVEVLSESLTHYYIKYLNSGHKTNVSKHYFESTYVK